MCCDIAEDKKHHDNMAKRMPGLNSPLNSPTISMRLLGRQAAGGPDAISISSLPVSESEDDLNGMVLIFWFAMCAPALKELIIG